MFRLMERLLRAAVAVLFLFFVSITFVQVLLRYLFSNSLGWVDELSRFAFIWLVFLAAALVARSGTHIVVDIIDSMVKGCGRRSLLVVSDVALCLFAAIVGIGGYRLMQVNWTSTAPATGLSMAWVQLILPVFGIATILLASRHAWDVMTGRDASADPDEPKA